MTSSPADIAAGLRLTPAEVQNALSVALQRGLVEESDGRYRVGWPWFRAVTRVLYRKNLQAR